ncbi:hypothetical protein BGZ80_007032 [Entomortierella chlamydospora]|uniref:Mitochondrial import inner membrane translocase subunit tim16 n=1 Tax=Entomortierella chlamydospora TaxID=101097 RepID=A0A9P6MZ38_9FUNG|nr:hypothetical protein BGZ80_007032 [Entomortierella chlamydospora]
MGTQVVGKAFMEAYRQAAANAAKNGGQHAAKNGSAGGSGGSKAAAADAITRKTGMTVDEAMNILNITKEADLAKIIKSKVVRAKERLEMEWDAQGNPMKIESEVPPAAATDAASPEPSESKASSHPPKEDRHA